MSFPDAKHVRAAKGFTLAELLISLMITAVILCAVASLAFASNSARTSTDELSEMQAVLRYSVLRLPDMIKHSIQAIEPANDAIALWKSDENGDGQINGSELIYLQADAAGTSLELLGFPGQTLAVSEANIQSGLARDQLIAVTTETVTTIVPECANISFTLSAAGLVTVTYDLTENGVSRSYQFRATSRGSTDYLASGGS